MTISAHTIHAYVGTTELSVTDASITLDESWAPYAQASLTVAMPSLATISALDPRNDVRIQIVINQDYGTSQPISTLSSGYGGHPISYMSTEWNGKFVYQWTNKYFVPFNSFGVRGGHRRVLNLTLRERVLDHASSTVSLALSSDEALLQDYALVSTSTWSAPTTSVRTTVAYVLSLIGKSLRYGTLDGTFLADAGKWEPGQTAWQYLEPLVQTAGLRLYCDEVRNWYLVEENSDSPGSIALSYTGTMTEAADSISRNTDEWFDAVVIKYTYVDGAGNTVTAYDTANSGTITKVLSLNYDTAYPGAGAAARVLSRAQGKGHTNSVSAISDYSATPGQVCSITMPDTVTQMGNIASVTWNYPSDEMSIKTRGLLEVPATAWIFSPVGRRWQDIAVGTDWTEYAA